MSQHLSFMVFGADAESLNRIDGRWQRVIVRPCSRVRRTRGKCAMEIGRLRPSAAIIVLGESPEERLSLIRDLTRSHPETMLIGAASNASPDLILNSLRAGATEFLRLPLLDDEFATILDHAEEYASRQAASRSHEGE
jgi:DNA-binding NtrC family response regulator